MTILISFVAIVLALAIGFAVSRNPKQRDNVKRISLMKEYASARKMHRPSEKLWNELRDETTKQLKKEIA